MILCKTEMLKGNPPLELLLNELQTETLPIKVFSPVLSNSNELFDLSSVNDVANISCDVN